MTLKRLFILLGILVVLAGAGIMGLWQYAYTPEGRARVIIAQLRGDTSTLRGWMLQHRLIRPGFSENLKETSDDGSHTVSVDDRNIAAAGGEMVKLGRQVLPIMIEALRDDNRDVRMVAIRACGAFPDRSAIAPLVRCMKGAKWSYHYPRPAVQPTSAG